MHTHKHTHTHTHTNTHTVSYHVCFGGGVEGSSEEWGPPLALVPLLREVPTATGRDGKEKNKCLKSQSINLTE